MINVLLKSLALVILFSALVSGVAKLTQPKIEAEEQAYRQRQLASILPAGSFDPPLQPSARSLIIEGIEEPASVYLAWKNHEPMATLIELTTDEGYSGDIRILMAVDANGALIAARILAHKETPGLGDAIDVDKSDWIHQFSGLSLSDLPMAQWRPDRLGGEFDTISSATITSKAVTLALARGLQAYEQHGDSLWQQAPP